MGGLVGKRGQWLRSPLNQVKSLLPRCERGPFFFFKSKLLSIGTLVDVWIDRD